MDKFINKYQQLIVSCVWLLVGVLGFGWSVYYQPMQAMAQDARKVTSNVAAQTRELENYLKTAERTSNTQVKEELVVFLKNINKLAEDNSVIIQKLRADPKEELVYNIEIRTDYYTFIKFATDLEGLDVSIEELEVHPYNPGAQPPEHYIAFSIQPQNNASPLQTARVARLKEVSRKEGLRNPFQRFAKTTTTAGLKIDLTWVYEFTGVGKIGGQYYATIDSTDYEVGDVIDGKVVSKIAKDRVLLNDEGYTPEGGLDKSQYSLRFRPR